ncbi:MAG TPA: fumarylacetoacetate hydrolase family protein [Pseudobdellovibrionaceae bacterium]|jgi:2-keto-4-pentenoate hydratase/2-oxohepta-3-ene-1,7-dioic acid hydratase in catechol pathway
MTIRNIWAVGRNYAEHAQELDNEIPNQTDSEPMVFLKAGSTAVINSKEFKIPAWAQNVHHEIELALQFNEHLKIDKAALALDLTERTWQQKLKAKGSPWTLAKSFTNSCPLSDFFTVDSLEELKNLNFSLTVNGELRQKGNTSQMIFPVPQLVEYILLHFPVCPGDLLLTGTPSGVAALQRGDQLVAELPGKVHKQWKAL